jgi:Fe-S oxidoreductase
MLVEKNISLLNKCTFKKIVTTDPHTYNALKNFYGDFGAHYEVLHYTELLGELIRNGKLKLQRAIQRPVTYHDPCYLARYNCQYDAPRKLLSAIGAELIELPNNRMDTYCCGAGGGRIWMEDKPGSKERPSERRIREATALGSVHTLITSCPKDFVMFQDAVKTTGSETAIVIKDIAELILEAAEPEKREI